MTVNKKWMGHTGGCCVWLTVNRESIQFKVPFVLLIFRVAGKDGTNIGLGGSKLEHGGGGGETCGWIHLQTGCDHNDCRVKGQGHTHTHMSIHSSVGYAGVAVALRVRAQVWQIHKSLEVRSFLSGTDLRLSLLCGNTDKQTNKQTNSVLHTVCSNVIQDSIQFRCSIILLQQVNKNDCISVLCCWASCLG